MTQQEFTERTGITPTNKEFVAITNMYMAAGEIDKDAFCADYKKHKDSKLLSYFYELYKVWDFNLKQIDTSLLKVAKYLLIKSREFNDKSMRAEAIDLLGEKMIVRLTMEMDLELWDDDKKFIIDNLKDKKHNNG